MISRALFGDLIWDQREKGERLDVTHSKLMPMVVALQRILFHPKLLHMHWICYSMFVHYCILKDNSDQQNTVVLRHLFNFSMLYIHGKKKLLCGD